MISKALCFIIHLLLITSHAAQASNTEKIVNVGAIFDFNSRIGREQRAAMEIAARSYNENSNKYKVLLNFQDSRREALTAASSAKQMIEDKKAEVIIGMDTWKDAVLVGKVGNKTQIPVISLAAPSITPPLMQLRWPFVVTMANDASAEIGCIADLVCAYKWRKVVVIYEDDEYGDGLGSLSLLNSKLQKFGSDIEYRLVLPPYSSLSDPKGFVLNELIKVLDVRSRVFIILRSSLPMINHLFIEAKKLHLLESESAWIVTESITSLLDSIEDSVVPLMKGIIGIKTHYSKSGSLYEDFRNQFKKTFEEQNQDTLNPGIYALHAHDGIQTITQAMERTSNENKTLLEKLLLANFNGLSGTVSFKEGKLSDSPILRIVNVVSNEERELNPRTITYKELSYWMPECGFVEKAIIGKPSASDCKSSSDSVGSVVWPGNLNERNPKGWAMPTFEKPLRIAVPGKTQFSKFVTVDESKKHLNSGYDGLSIRIFNMVQRQLNYKLHFNFDAFYGNYDELVEAVSNKIYDAAVGDITITAKRSKDVEFTQPYLESGLSMIIPTKSKESASIFMKPFTWDVWLVNLVILVYTMVIVWFLEHPTNPEFSGTLKNQIGTTLWFTFSSLFFVQRERIHSNITKVAVTIWLCLVFILTSSYTANLSSMLTVRQLEPDINIEWLKSTNQKVGCDGDSFITKYLEEVLDFKQENIYSVPSEYSYVDWFSEKNISAAFLELPYEKVFLNQNCNGFKSTARSYKFGGFGFVFQKGSPIARDVSEEILKLSENGNITALENQCLTPNECSQNSLSTQTESLSFKSFRGVYVMSGTTSTICFLIALLRIMNKNRHHQPESSTEHDQSVKNKAVGLARYFYKGKASYSPGKAKTLPARATPSRDEFSSSTWEFDGITDIQNSDHDASPPAEIEIAVQTR